MSKIESCINNIIEELKVKFKNNKKSVGPHSNSIPKLNFSDVHFKNVEIKRNRNKISGVKYILKGSRTVAIHCESDTFKRVAALPQPKDLTRYGIESNPGPMTSIPEDNVYNPNVKIGTYAHCRQCDEEVFLFSSDSLVFYINLCENCMLEVYEPQGLFSEATTIDIVKRVADVKSWLYEGDKHGQSFLAHYVNIPEEVQKHVSLIEDALILLHHMLMSQDTFGRYLAVINFCKLRGSRLGFTSTMGYIVGDICSCFIAEKKKEHSLYKEVLENMPYEPQGFATDFDSLETLTQFRGYLGMYEKLKETTLYKKCYKFLCYMLTLGLLDKVNITYDSLNFSEFEKNCTMSTHKPGFDMVYCIIDTITFICERGMYFFRTGDVECIFHSGGSYENWIKTANRLIRESKFLSNPKPHGIDPFKFHNELLDAIEKGKGIVRFTASLEKYEKNMVNRYLFDLQLIESNEVTKKNAQKPRKDPFAVLIHGSSNICKSQLIQILFHHYGKVFGLPTESEYMYTRCPVDEFWSGFNSSQWCIVMDDIAFLKPNNEVDPTLKEMLQVKNSVPYIPPQAALEDKGKTPVKAELVIGTTNTKKLNLHAYFACPFAIARRMSYVITATVKKEFTKYSFMADSNLIPLTNDGEYMNIWNFSVSIPVPEKDVEIDAQQTKYSVIHEFEDIHDLLRWYIVTAKDHEVSQEKALSAVNVMSAVEVCEKCYYIKKKCTCFEAQNLEEDVVQDVVPVVASIEEVVVVEGDSVSVAEVPEGVTTEVPDSPPIGVIQTPVVEAAVQTAPIPPVEIDDDDVDPILYKDLNYIFQVRLWLVSKVIKHDVNPDIDTLIELLKLKKCYMGPFCLFLAYITGVLLWMSVKKFGNFWTVFFATSVIIIYHIYYYMWKLFAYYFMWYYGSMWKFYLAKKVLPYNYDCNVFIFRLLGCRVRGYFTNARLKTLFKYCCGISAVYYTYCAVYFGKKAVKKYRQHKWTKADMKLHYEMNCPYNCYPDMEAQGNIGTTPVPLEQEKPTFYYNDPYKITGVEISGQSACVQGDVLRNKVIYNTAKFKLTYFNCGKTCITTAVNIKGNIWLLNRHSIRVEDATLDVIFEDVEQNVSRNVSGLKICVKDYKHIKDTDLLYVAIRSIPPGQNLIPYMAKSKINGVFKGEYHMITDNGIRSIKKIVDIKPGECFIHDTEGTFNCTIRGFYGKVEQNTAKGDCGAMCIAEIGSAQVLLGIHSAGNMTKGIFMQALTQDFMNDVLEKFEPQVDMGVIPISAGEYVRKVGPVHQKATLRWLPKGTVHVMGSFTGYRPKHKSKVKKSYICDYVRDEYPNEFGAPDVSWRPWHLAIKDMSSPNLNFRHEWVQEVEDAYFNDVADALGDKIKLLEVYTQDVALNGVEGITFVDRINVSTSAGNPFKKSKKHFLNIAEDGNITGVAPVIQERIDEIEKCYDEGRRFHPQFCAHLKDEPTPAHKIEAGKTRVFTGSEFAWSIVVRKYFLSHIRLMENNPFIFECMPGIVAQSSEWYKLHNYLVQFGEDQLVAGDYEKFDKKMAAEFILAAYNVLIRLAERAGWSEQDLMVLRCIAYDTAFPCVDFNGDLIEIQGNPSGHPLTVIINCIVNSLYMRFAFKMCSGKRLLEFKKMVALATYGDDNSFGVSKECPNFNHTRIAVTLRLIGVGYTMADKESLSVPYIHINDVSFLKRRFVLDKENDIMLAPLEHKSIDKMLTTHLDNGVIAAEAHSICVIETALREYFFYGKEKFEERRNYFIALISRAKLTDWVRGSTLPTYDSVLSDYIARSNKISNSSPQ
jgi:hypothetical protein